MINQSNNIVYHYTDINALISILNKDNIVSAFCVFSVCV